MTSAVQLLPGQRGPGGWVPWGGEGLPGRQQGSNANHRETKAKIPSHSGIVYLSVIVFVSGLHRAGCLPGNRNGMTARSLDRPSGPLSTRRAFLASLCALPLAGCQDGSESIRFRVIAMVMYQGRKYEASTVMECLYTRVTNSLVGRGGSTRLYGESLIFDLPNGKTFFVLPVWNATDGSLLQVFQSAVLRTFGIESSLGSLSDEDFARIKALLGRRPFKYYGHMPAFISFRDETQPKTLFEFQPYEMEQTFPGVKFIGLDIEITDAPVTTKLRERLPWLNTGRRLKNPDIFPRDPPGHRRPDRDVPIAYKITDTHFFGNGSR